MFMTCIEDKTNPGSSLCACTYPLSILCEDCQAKHLARPDFHFPLPVSASEVITSETDLHQWHGWLFQLMNRHKELRKTIEKVDECRKHIENAREEIIATAHQVEAEFLQKLEVLRSSVGGLIEAGIANISEHALEFNTFNPQDEISDLIWSKANYNFDVLQLFDFKVESDKENVRRSFKVRFGAKVGGREQEVDEFEDPRKTEYVNGIEAKNEEIRLLRSEFEVREKELKEENQKVRCDCDANVDEQRNIFERRLAELEAKYSKEKLRFITHFESSRIELEKNNENLLCRVESLTQTNEDLKKSIEESKAIARNFPIVETLKNTIDDLEKELSTLKSTCERLQETLHTETTKNHESNLTIANLSEKVALTDIKLQESSAHIDLLTQKLKEKQTNIRLTLKFPNPSRTEITVEDRFSRNLAEISFHSITSFPFKNLIIDATSIYFPKIKTDITVKSVEKSLLRAILPENLSLYFDFDPADSIAALKSLICEKADISVENCYLLYRKQLLDDSRSVADYSLPYDSHITVTTIKIGISFKDFPMINIHPEENATVSTLLETVCEHYVIPIEKAKLKCNGITLENERLLRSYPFCTGAVFNLLLDFSIFIKTVDNRIFPVKVDSSFRISDVKSAIFDVLNIGPDIETLSFKGKYLDSERLLSDYSIEDQSVIHFHEVSVTSDTGKIEVSEIETRKLITIFAFLCETVREIREKVAWKFRVDVGSVMLSFLSVELRDQRKIGEYKIEYGSLIYMNRKRV